MTAERPASTDLPELRVLPGPDEVAAAAAEEIARILADAVRERGVAHWSTTGGSAAPPMYRLLSQSPLRDRVDWRAVHAWWGDDRYVPYDHPLSNVLPFEEIFLAAGGSDTGQSGNRLDTGPEGSHGVDMPVSNLHRWPVPEAIAHGAGPAWAAARYAEDLREFGPPTGPDGLPAFDLIVLGVGPDGHLLSVFPGSSVWDAPGLCEAVPAPTHVEPHVERVTMHPKLLAAARRLLVVTTGGSKADVLARAWTGDDVRELPVRSARLPTATWLLDEAAAKGMVGG
jgi:6-phosphogluconolactonase